MLTSFNCYNALKDIIGSCVTGVQYMVHIAGSDVTAISAKIIFSSNTNINVRCASDGESLQIGQDNFEPADLGASGQLKLVDVNEFDPACLLCCLGDTVKCITVTVGNELPKALRIEWNDCHVFFSNVGDILSFEETRFKQMITEEKWDVLTEVIIQ